MIDFPNNPTVNQTFTASTGVTYTWDGAVWMVAGPGSALWSDTGTALTNDCDEDAERAGTSDRLKHHSRHVDRERARADGHRGAVGGPHAES